MILAVDREALQEVSESNPRVATVDGFTGEMTDFTLIFETVEQSCTIEPSLTETGNLQIAIVAKGDNNSEFCHEKAHVRSLNTAQHQLHTSSIPSYSNN